MTRRSVTLTLVLSTAAASLGLMLPSAQSRATDSLQGSPFAYGDQRPDLIASCDDLRNWADKAPQTTMRIDLAVKGELSRVYSDGVLVYLVMCKAPNPQIMCVTYQQNGMNAGDIVTFGGGYRRLGADKMILDPCLARRDRDRE